MTNKEKILSIIQDRINLNHRRKETSRCPSEEKHAIAELSEVKDEIRLYLEEEEEKNE